MTGIIPEEDDEEQEMYDDVGHMDDIYEVLPGLSRLLICYSLIYDDLQSNNTNLSPTHPFTSPLPEEEMPTPVKSPPKVDPGTKPAPPPPGTQH